jgi:hypothetical protein
LKFVLKLLRARSEWIHSAHIDCEGYQALVICKRPSFLAHRKGKAQNLHLRIVDRRYSLSSDGYVRIITRA